MKRNNLFKKKIIHIYILIFIIVLLIIITGTLILKYNIEGEKNIPFKITKIGILSTAESKISQSEENWIADVIQKNDIFFTIQKNDEYKKEDAIKKITFNNISIDKKTSKGTTNIYKPSKENNEYTYVEEYIIDNELEYEGGQSTNSEILQINNQGGVIGFSVATKDLGNYELNINEKLASDGTLLSKINLNQEDIELEIEFDLIIETEKGQKFKSNIKLQVPTDNIIERGISKKEDTELKNVIFKRF